RLADDLVAGPQLLVDLLAGKRARELDRDVALGLEPGELDHVPREVEDAHRLAHVQDEDLAAAADRARLDDERDGLRDGHEEARHLGVPDGDRSAALDLAA